MSHKLFFQINNSEPKEFLTVEDGNKPLNLITIAKLPSQEDLNKLQESGCKYYLVAFQDEEGNQFKIFSTPENDK